jgi:hypothetical protein
MGNMSGVVQQLKKELERAKREVAQYGAALLALGSSQSRSQGHTVSAAARKRMSLAQKARWAKRSDGRAAVVKHKHTLSVAARSKIAAAQRARWAKVKGQKKAA